MTKNKMGNLTQAEIIEKLTAWEEILQKSQTAMLESIDGYLFCPRCHATFEAFDKYHYCPDCGQKVFRGA